MQVVTRLIENGWRPFMDKRIILIVLLIIASSCNKNDTTSANYEQTVDSVNWVTFNYTEVKGYVTRTPWTNELLVVNDRLSSLVSDRFEITLTESQERTLLEIINKPDADGDYSSADCFYPRHGFVFWDSVGQPSGHISICFECNKLKANPELDKLDLAEVETFCREIGLPVFDNPLEHEKYFDSLERKNGR